MGPQEDYIETVLTCEGDFYDPEFHEQLHNFSKRLQELITSGQRQLILKKVEPWNSVRVTFNIPKEAAVRLKQLAEQGDQTLRGLGILAVQIEGDRVISLTIQGKNNETTELVFTTPGPSAAVGASSVYDISSADELNLPGPSNVEATRKNIAEYLSQQGAGPGFLHSFLNQQPPGLDLKPPSASVPTTEPQPQRSGPQSSTFPSFGSPSRSPSHSVAQAVQGRSPAGFPSPSSASQSQQSFPSPGSQRGQMSPVSPKYPTPPPSVPPPHPSSPGIRVTHQLQQQQQLQQQMLQQQQLQQQQAMSHHPQPLQSSQMQHQQQQQQQSQQLQQQSQQSQQQSQQNFPGLPFPHGSPNVNNLQRAFPNKDITSSSPLLVNLLQSDVAGGHFSHLPQHKMPPPFETGHSTVKRKRRPRKPKDGSPKQAKGADCEMGPGDQMAPPLPMLECRVPPTGLEMMTQSLPSAAVSSMSPTLTQSTTPSLKHGVNSAVRSSPERAGNPQHIINPYTGQLEPRDARVDTAVKAENHSSVHNDSNSFSDTGSNTGLLDTAPQLRPPPNPMVDIENRLAANQNPQQHHPPHPQRQSSPRSEFRPGPSLGPHGPHLYNRLPNSPASIQENMFPRNCSPNGNLLPGGNMYPDGNTHNQGRMPFSATSPVSIPNATPPIRVPHGHQRLPMSSTVCSSGMSRGSSLGQHLPPQVSPLVASTAMSGLPPPPPYTSATTSSLPQGQVTRVKSPIAAQATALSSALAAPPLVEPALVKPRSHAVTSVNNNLASARQQHTSAVMSSTVTTSCVASYHTISTTTTTTTTTINTTSTITSIPTVCSTVTHGNPVTCTSSTSALLTASSHTHSNGQKDGTSTTVTHTTVIATQQQPPTERTRQSESNSSARVISPTGVAGQSQSLSIPTGSDNGSGLPRVATSPSVAVANTKENVHGSGNGSTESSSSSTLENSKKGDGSDHKGGDGGEDGSPGTEGSLTPASTSSAPTPSTPPNCSAVDNCLGLDSLKVEGKEHLKGAQVPTHHRHLLQHSLSHSGLGSGMALSAVAMHNDLHGLTRGSNGASTGSASPASDATSSTGVPLSGHSPLTNNILHDSELSSHSFEDNSPAQPLVGSDRGLGLVITRENHSNDAEKMSDHDNLKENNDNDASAKDQEPHKNVIHVGYALSKEPSLNNLLSDTFLKGLGGMPFLAKPGSMESDGSKGVSLSEELLGKKGFLKSQALIQKRDSCNQEVQESCPDEDLLTTSTKAHLNLTRCISIPNKLLVCSDLKLGDKPTSREEGSHNPVNGNDTGLRTDLKFSAVGIRTALWLGRDQKATNLEAEGLQSKRICTGVVDEARPGNTSCMNHTASEGGGGEDPDPDSGQPQPDTSVGEPQEAADSPRLDNALEDNLPGHQGTMTSKQEDGCASVETSDETDGSRVSPAPPLSTDRTKPSSSGSTHSTPPPSGEHNWNQSPDLVRPEGLAVLAVGPACSVASGDARSVYVTSSAAADAPGTPSSCLPSPQGGDHNTIQDVSSSCDLAPASSTPVTSSPPTLPDHISAITSTTPTLCDSTQLSPQHSASKSVVTTSPISRHLSFTACDTTTVMTSSNTRNPVCNCRTTTTTTTTTSTTTTTTTRQEGPTASTGLVAPTSTSPVVSTGSSQPDDCSGNEPMTGKDLAGLSSFHGSRFASAQATVTKHQALKTTVRITPPPGISLAPPPLTTKNEATLVSLPTGHRVLVAPGVSTRTVTSLSPSLRSVPLTEATSLVEPASQSKSETDKFSKEPETSNNPVPSLERQASCPVEDPPHNSIEMQSTTVATSTTSVLSSLPSSLQRMPTEMLQSPVASNSSSSSSTSSLEAGSPASTSPMSRGTLQDSLASTTPRTVPSQPVSAPSTGASLVNMDQEVATTQSSGNAVPSQQQLSRSTVMTLVMPHIVPPLLHQGPPSAISLNSDNTGHPLSLRDLTSEKQVVTLMANASENDTDLFVKCIAHGTNNTIDELTEQLLSSNKDRQVSLPAGPEDANGTLDQGSPHYQQRRQMQFKGISILKPLFDRDNEPLDDSELEAIHMDAVAEKKWSRTTKKTNKASDVHNNSNAGMDTILPQKVTNPQYTIAQLLDDVAKRKMKVEQNVSGQQPLPLPQTVVISQDNGSKPGGQQQPLPTSMSLVQSHAQQSHQQSTHQPISSAARSALTTSKQVNTAAMKPHAIAALSDYPRNSTMHLSNFMAKSMHTPPLINPTPHPMTAPGFALNLTESVQKVMSAIPYDSLSPPLHPPRVNRTHRANVSPAAKEKPVEASPTEVSPVRLTASMVPTQLMNTQICTKAGSQKVVTESPLKDTVIKQELIDAHQGSLGELAQSESRSLPQNEATEVVIKAEETQVKIEATENDTMLSVVCESSTIAMQLPCIQSSNTTAPFLTSTKMDMYNIADDTKTNSITDAKIELGSTDMDYSGAASTADTASSVTPSISEMSSKLAKHDAEPRPERITRRPSRESTESQGKERDESPRVTPTRGRKKSASESSDTTMNSEASSEGMTLRGGRSTDRSSERSESPPPTRATRSTRSVRKRVSPDGDDSNAVWAVTEMDRSESPKPSKQTRGSKRKLELDDGPSDHTDKKVKADEEEAGLRQVESSEEDLTLNELRLKGGVSSGGGKVTRTVGTKCGTKDDQQAADDKNSPKGKKVVKQDEVKEAEEQNGSKRIWKNKIAVAVDAVMKKSIAGTATRRAAEKRPKSPSLTEDKPNATAIGRVRNRTTPTLLPVDDDNKSTDGDDAPKRSTRSSRSKDHCELLPPLNKRRRSSRDHR